MRWFLARAVGSAIIAVKQHGRSKSEDAELLAIERQVFTLALPPSVNSLWTNVRGRGRVRTPAYDRWRKAAGWELQAQRPKAVKGRVAIQIRASPPVRKRDLDNLAKPALDLLVAHGAIEDDAMVCSLSLAWDRTVESGKIKVAVRRRKLTAAP